MWLFGKYREKIWEVCREVLGDGFRGTPDGVEGMWAAAVQLGVSARLAA